ncbi:MAG TPA: trypsin-like serine protease [Polyangiaceae bacterium]|nr:trypsin-like serine protease [Polyangiaceae bacterium]
MSDALNRVTSRLRLLLLQLAIGCAPAPEQSGQQACEIVGGNHDPGRPFVVAIADDQNVVRCTGAVVSPLRVVTAAHCLVDGAEAMRVYLTASEPALEVSRSTVHPEFWSGPLAREFRYDLALLTLPEATSIEPVVLADSSPREDQPVSIVGFGRTEASCAGAGAKQAGTMAIAGVSELTMELAPAPASSCYIDSGGPVLATSEAGEDSLVGIISTGSATCRGSSVATRVDVVREFILAAEP